MGGGGGYKNARSKAVCRCAVDGCEWSATATKLIHGGTGCPQCAGMRRWTAEERIGHINALPGVTFSRWVSAYETVRSKAMCRCDEGHEWPAEVLSLVTLKSKCPQCAEYRFNPAKPATLYILRSECGSMVKIGISNDYKRRHVTLKSATPFNWHCIELLHSDDGSLIAEWEKELHSWTEQAKFREPFDGYTEWRKWDPRLPMWLKRYRARLARYNKAP